MRLPSARRDSAARWADVRDRRRSAARERRRVVCGSGRSESRRICYAHARYGSRSYARRDAAALRNRRPAAGTFHRRAAAAARLAHDRVRRANRHAIRRRRKLDDRRAAPGRRERRGAEFSVRRHRAARRRRAARLQRCPYGAASKLYRIAADRARVSRRARSASHRRHRCFRACDKDVLVRHAFPRRSQQRRAISGSAFIAGTRPEDATISVRSGSLHMAVPVRVTTAVARAQVLPLQPVLQAHETVAFASARVRRARVSDRASGSRFRGKRATGLSTIAAIFAPAIATST